MTRRTMVVMSAITVVLAVPAVAHAAEVDDYLLGAAQAEFSGTQMVSCNTPDGVREAVVDVAQTGESVVATARGSSDVRVVVAAGTLEVTRPDGSSRRTTVDGAPGVASQAYVVGAVSETTVLGREAIEVGIEDRDGVARARLVFDSATGALVESDVFDGDGDVYCETRMLEFSAAPPAATAVDAAGSTVLDAAQDPKALPPVVGGFERLDSYEWSDGGVIGFYSDGLFSFSLLATDRPVELNTPGSVDVEVNGHDSYQRWFGPGQVVLVWDTGDGGLALTGDLPTDLIDDVVGELPQPRSVGFFSRVWRNLFG